MAFVQGNGYVGDFLTGKDVCVFFNTTSSTGIPTTLAGSPVVAAYKDGSKNQTITGPTLSVDFDSVTGMHHVTCATTDNFYATGQDYKLVITTGTVGGESVVGAVVGSFSIQNRSTPSLVWDEVLTAGTHNINNSAGRRLRGITSQVIMTGTILAATENTVNLDLGASDVNGAYDPALLVIETGTGAGQCRNIFQYVGSTRTCVVDRDWKTQPSTDSTYVILGDAGREHVNEGLLRAATLYTAQLNASASSYDNAYVGQILFLRSGLGEDQARRVIAYNGTTKTVTILDGWDQIPDATTAYAMLPTGRFTDYELQTMWDGVAAEHVNEGSFGDILGRAGDICDKLGVMVEVDDIAGPVWTSNSYHNLPHVVWDDLTTNHAVTDSFAESISDIKVVTDKLSRMIIYDELNGNVWTYNALEYVSSLVWDRPAGYHLTDTTMGKYMNDLKDTSVKLEGMMESAGDAGYRYTAVALEEAPGGEAEGLLSRTYTVYALDGRTPVPNVQVWATTDAAGLNRVDALKITNDLGQVTFRFNLPVGTHVWIWNRSSSVGDEEIV